RREANPLATTYRYSSSRGATVIQSQARSQSAGDKSPICGDRRLSQFQSQARSQSAGDQGAPLFNKSHSKSFNLRREANPLATNIEEHIGEIPLGFNLRREANPLA